MHGIRDDLTVRRVDQRLGALDILRLEALDDVRAAATLYRNARRRGRTIRRTLDCLIAAVGSREGRPILHNDRDFDHLAAVTARTVHAVAGSEPDRTPSAT